MYISAHLILTWAVKKENYAVLRDATIPAVLIEVEYFNKCTRMRETIIPGISGITGRNRRNGILDYDNAF